MTFLSKNQLSYPGCRQAAEGGGRAFSLVELLAVMALVSLLTMALVPSMQGTLDGISIGGAAGVAETEMSLARQTAISRNVPVEMRIYKHDDGTGTAWRLVALVIPGSATGRSDEWITAGKVLPGHVVMEDSGNFSTVLSGAAAPSSGTRVAPWTGQEGSAAPALLRGKNYVGFLFQPDGSTDLPAGRPWCLTLRSSHSQVSGDKPPANFVSLVIDSATGRTLSYQP